MMLYLRYNFSNFVVALSRLSILFYSLCSHCDVLRILFFLLSCLTFFALLAACCALSFESIDREREVVFFVTVLPPPLVCCLFLFFFCLRANFSFFIHVLYCMHACMFDPESLCPIHPPTSYELIASEWVSVHVCAYVCMCVRLCLQNTRKYLLLLFSPFTWHLANTSGYKSIYIYYICIRYHVIHIDNTYIEMLFSNMITPTSLRVSPNAHTIAQYIRHTLYQS